MSRNVPRCVGGVRPGGTSGAIRSVSSQLAFFLVSIGAVPFSAGRHRFFSPGGAHPPARAHRSARREERGWRHDVNEKTDSTSANPGSHENWRRRICGTSHVPRQSSRNKKRSDCVSLSCYAMAALWWEQFCRKRSFQLVRGLLGWWAWLFGKQKLRGRHLRRQSRCGWWWTVPGSRGWHPGFRFLTTC